MAGKGKESLVGTDGEGVFTTELTYHIITLLEMFSKNHIFIKVILGATTLVPNQFDFEISFQNSDLGDTCHVRNR